MNGSGPAATTSDPAAAGPGPVRRVLSLTLGKAWDDDIFSHSAQAAFWQALSLPPLFLALLGSLGFVGGWFGPETVQLVDGTIIDFARRVFTAEVVDEIIAPTANDILNQGRADVVSVGFVVSLWAGSSAVASIVDSITHAHDQKLVRQPGVAAHLLAADLPVRAGRGHLHAADPGAGAGPAARRCCRRAGARWPSR